MNKTPIAPQFTGFITNFIRKGKSVVASAPTLIAASRTPHGPFQFQVKVTSECSYEVLASSDLRNWVSLVEGNNAPGDIVSFTDTDAPKFSYRFYRARCGELVSTNVIGFATAILPPGFSMISNPFHAASNRVADLFPELADGTTFCKFDTSLFRLTNNGVKNGSWSNPDELFVPGEGAILFNPTTNFVTLHFVGDVKQGQLDCSIPAGLSIRSSLVPQPGRLSQDLEFPVADGDVIHLFDRDQQKYIVYPYSAEEWEKNPPSIGVAESFWIGKTNPASCVRDFRVA